MKSLLKKGLLISIVTTNLLFAQTSVEPKVALQMLDTQNKEFKQQIIQTAPNVYTAVGYHGANTSMIVGDDGVIIVDTLMGPTSAQNAFNEFRKITNKPVKAIIYTHSHMDHIGGASVFTEGKNIDIYSSSNFKTPHGAASVLAPIMKDRGIHQFGRLLQTHEETNRGVAPAKTIDFDTQKGYIKANIQVKEKVTKLNIAGVDLELIKAPGETDDALFVWLPKEKVLLAGDNFYKSFPNLYALRGTPYRNVLNWSKSLKLMASYEPEYLIPGHTTPIKGKEEATQALNDYSDAIKSVYDQTVKGINEGKSPELIALEVKLPENLKDKRYLIEYYGTVHHAVRAIYAGLLGWYDGNPTNLNPLHPKEKALKMAKLAGGVEMLQKQLNNAMTQKDYQWALELCDSLRWIYEKDEKKAKTIIETKIKALRALAQMQYNAPSRNYYLSYANYLEQGKINKPWH